jgi:hypothetical protein
MSVLHGSYVTSHLRRAMSFILDKNATLRLFFLLKLAETEGNRVVVSTQTNNVIVPSMFHPPTCVSIHSSLGHFLGDLLVFVLRRDYIIRYSSPKCEFERVWW